MGFLEKSLRVAYSGLVLLQHHPPTAASKSTEICDQTSNVTKSLITVRVGEYVHLNVLTKRWLFQYLLLETYILD
jgi:hypothetical protein